MLNLTDEDLEWIEEKKKEDRLSPSVNYSTHIMVENLPKTYFMKDIKKCFSKFGTVGMIIQTTTEESKKAEVTFNFPNEAEQAESVGPIMHEEKEYQFIVKRIPKPPSKRVVIRNLPRSLQHPGHLYSLFPRAEHVDVQNAGDMEMRCYVSFRNAHHALDAIERTSLRSQEGHHVNVTIVLAPFSGKNQLRMLQRKKALKRKIDEEGYDPTLHDRKRRNYGPRGRGRGRGRYNNRGRGYAQNNRRYSRNRRRDEKSYWGEEYYMYDYDDPLSWKRNNYDPYEGEDLGKDGGNFKVLYEDDSGTYARRPARRRPITDTSSRDYLKSSGDFSV